MCGAVRWEYDGEIGAAAYCHCEDCRRMTGSAFGISVRMTPAGFRIVSGAPKEFTSRGEGGSEVTRCFCPDCGSPVYGFRPNKPQTYFVKAGSLDDPTLVKPTGQYWTHSAVEWGHIAPDLPAYEKDLA